MKDKINENLPYISFFSVTSAIGVVYMHLCGFHGMRPALNATWILSLVIEKLCVCAVPVFFMITGSTLIDYPKKYDDKTYFKKRLNKVVIPWLAWGGYPFYITIASAENQTKLSALQR